MTLRVTPLSKLELVDPVGWRCYTFVELRSCISTQLHMHAHMGNHMREHGDTASGQGTTDAALEIFLTHASFCQVFSDEKRLRIMWFLGEEERSVGEIAAHLGGSLANASQHLRVMRDKGAVRFRKEGQTVFYRIANRKFLAGCRLIREGLLEQLGEGARLQDEA